LEILPEGTAENRVIGWRPGPDGTEQAAPGIRHAAAEAVEVEAKTCGGVQQAAGGFVQRETAGRRFLEHALADEVPQHSPQRVGVGARRRGQVLNLSYPGGQ